MEEKLSELLSESPFRYRPFCLLSAVYLICTVGMLSIGWVALAVALALWGVYLLYAVWKTHSLRSILTWLLLATVLFSAAVCCAYTVPRGKTRELALDASPSLADDPSEKSVVAEVESVIYAETFGESYYVRLKSIDGQSVKGHAVIEVSGQIAAKVYDTVVCDGVFGEYIGYGSNGNRTYAASKDIVLLLETDCGRAVSDNKDTFRYFIYGIRQRIDGMLGEVCHPHVKSFAMAVMFGVRDGMSETLDRDFSSMGITHLLAVSGSHFSALSAMLIFMLRRVRFAKRWRIAPLMIFTVLFSALSGFSGAVLRAAIMALFALAVRFLGYRPDPFTALFFSAFSICLFKPYIVFDIGFLLSFFATLGLLFQLGQFKLGDKYSHIVVRTLSVIWESIKLTAAATLFTIPIMVFCYGTLSALCLPVNLVAGPIITVAMFIAIATAILCRVPLLGKATVWLFDACYRGISEGAEMIGVNLDASVSLRTPFVMYSLAACLGLYLLFRLLHIRKRWVVFVPMTLVVVCITIGNIVYAVTADQRSIAAVVSVNGSDCLVLNTGGKTLICDVGNGSKAAPMRAVDAAFDNLYATDIDGYIVTGYSTPQISTLGKLMRNYYIRTLYLPETQSENDKAIGLSIRQYAEMYGSKVEYYDPDECLKLYGAEISVYEKPIYGSDKRGFSVGFTTPNGGFLYMNPSAAASDDGAEVVQVARNTNVVVIGSNGADEWYQPSAQPLLTGAEVYKIPSDENEQYGVAIPLATSGDGGVTAFFRLRDKDK